MDRVLKYLLDSDLVSQRTKPRPEPRVTAWSNSTGESNKFISVLTIHELQTGVELLPLGRRRVDLERWLEERVVAEFAPRTLPVTTEIAREAGRLMAVAKLSGHTAGVGDALIAATARVHGLVMATLNVKHFSLLGVEVLSL